MGPKNSKECQINLMKDYDIIQTNQNQNITFLQHKKTEDEYLLKEFNFNDKKECEKTKDKLAELKNKLCGNKHVVPLKDYLMSSEDQYCSTFYKIYALFQYPQRTLDDEINQRKLHRKRFTQTQLWSILASCIVGLSHLQKNGIKHCALKSNNILLSRQGIIKVSDPFAMGQQSNYDAALTKRSTVHAYLSPQQTQALQQQLVAPSYNIYKSDIFTLGMIMLEAGLLEYQDQQCYRDEKTRIHWETIKYNVDRLGQAYSDEIKNMIEFMLSKDQRLRPDWIDLEEHVMKSGDQIRRSMIQQEKKVQGLQHNDEFPANSNNKPLILNTRPNSQGPTLVANPSVQPHLGIQTPPRVYGQIYPPRVVVPQQTIVYQPYNGANTPFTMHPRQESPRVSQPSNPQLYNNGNQNVFIPSSSAIAHNSFGFPHSSTLGSGNAVLPTTTANPLLTQQTPNIPPLRPSLIDFTRPTRNIFPIDTYATKTKFDENLIIMVQDDEQGEANDQIQNDNSSQVVFNKQSSNINTNNKVTGFVNQNQMNNSPQNYQPSRYNSYSAHQKTAFSNFSTSQTRVVKPAPMTNQQQQRPTINQSVRPNSYHSNTQSNSNLQFVTEEFKMGSRYEGYKLNGLRHGYGKFYYQDGGMYDGDWKQNKMQGFGKLYYQSGKLAYEGQWKKDQFMGRGVLYNELPEALNQNFNYNNFNDADECWTKYQGQFSDDMKNGHGILYLSNGQRFQGTFEADIVQGPGVFYCRNGTKINGIWKGNVKEK